MLPLQVYMRNSCLIFLFKLILIWWMSRKYVQRVFECQNSIKAAFNFTWAIFHFPLVRFVFQIFLPVSAFNPNKPAILKTYIHFCCIFHFAGSCSIIEKNKYNSCMVQRFWFLTFNQIYMVKELPFFDRFDLMIDLIWSPIGWINLR